MSISVLRTADAWYVQTPTGAAARIDTRATTTGQLLAEPEAIVTAAASTGTVPVDGLALVSPVTAPCRVVAQMTNYASHVTDSGMNPDTIPLTFFRKSSGSISGPTDDIIRPAHVRLLDYEVEIGLVIGRELPVGTTVTEDNLAEYVVGLVVTDDVSAGGRSAAGSEPALGVVDRGSPSGSRCARAARDRAADRGCARRVIAPPDPPRGAARPHDRRRR